MEYKMLNRIKTRILTGVVVVVGTIYVTAAYIGNFSALQTLAQDFKSLLKPTRLRQAKKNSDLEAEKLIQNVKQAVALDKQIIVEPTNTLSSTSQILKLPTPQFDMKGHADECNELVRQYAARIAVNNKNPTKFINAARRFFKEWQNAYPGNNETDYLNMLLENGYESDKIPTKIPETVKVTKLNQPSKMTDVSGSDRENSTNKINKTVGATHNQLLAKNLSTTHNPAEENRSLFGMNIDTGTTNKRM